MSWLVPSLPSWARPTTSSSGPVSSSSDPPFARPAPNTDPTDPDPNPDVDLPPAFPALDSAQRSAPSSAPLPARPSSARRPPPAFALAPPTPPRSDHLALDAEEDDGPNPTHLADTVPGDMAPPPSTTARPAFGMQAGGDTSAGGGGGGGGGGLGSKKSRKVALGAGCSALDWARLTQSGEDLRGLGKGMGMMRVTADELAKHKTKDDAWSAFNGRVYNLSAYLRFHPGGEAELMRAAGRDGTKLFMLTHSWVNAEYMLQECCIGMLVKGQVTR